MRPYKMEITWIDYDSTNTDDVYRVDVYDNNKQIVITSWNTLGKSLGNTISIYMGRTHNEI